MGDHDPDGSGVGGTDHATEDYRFISAHLANVDAEIRRTRLEAHVYDLETQGYTVIENALPSEEVGLLTEALYSAAAEDNGGERPSLDGRTHADNTQEVVLMLARGGRPFERLVLHERVLPLVTYLLGEKSIISSVTGYIKGPGNNALGIHSDTAYVPDPLPPYAQVANVNYCLTDYTEADGCLTIVPGSHRYCHRPRNNVHPDEAVSIEAPAGSAILFHGNTWHGARSRQNIGLRLTISTLYCRMYMRPQERYDDLLAEEVIERNGQRLATLIGRELPTGWRSLAEAQRMIGRRKTNAGHYYRTRGLHA